MTDYECKYYLYMYIFLNHENFIRLQTFYVVGCCSVDYNAVVTVIVWEFINIVGGRELSHTSMSST